MICLTSVIMRMHCLFGGNTPRVSGMMMVRRCVSTCLPMLFLLVYISSFRQQLLQLSINCLTFNHTIVYIQYRDTCIIGYTVEDGYIVAFLDRTEESIIVAVKILIAPHVLSANHVKHEENRRQF